MKNFSMKYLALALLLVAPFSFGFKASEHVAKAKNAVTTAAQACSTVVVNASTGSVKLVKAHPIAAYLTAATLVGAAAVYVYQNYIAEETL